MKESLRSYLGKRKAKQSTRGHEGRGCETKIVPYPESSTAEEKGLRKQKGKRLRKSILTRDKASQDGRSEGGVDLTRGKLFRCR